MTAPPLAHRRSHIEAVLQPTMPGAVISAIRDGQPIEHQVLGTDGHGQPLSNDTLFPVASITKLATALSVLRLVDVGEVQIDDRLDAYMPDAAAAASGVTLQVLFTHTAGCKAWKTNWRHGRRL